MCRSAVVMFAAALVAAAWMSAPAGAAAPRLLMVSGEALADPVLLSDWEEIFRLVQALSEAPAAPRDSVAGRPSLRLSLFWDAALWEPYVRQGRLDSLTPEDANQFGRFYPAFEGRPALVDLPWAGTWPKRADAVTLAILERHGVPVRIERDDATNAWPWIGGGAGAVLAASAGAVFRWRRAFVRTTDGR